MSAPERTPESHKGILAWMGRHKLVSALAGTAILAGGVYASPVASEWLAANFALLRQGASARVTVWMEALKKYLYEWLVPKPVRDGIDTTLRVKRSVEQGADVAGAAVGGFQQGLGQGVGNILSTATAPARGLNALKDWFLGK